MRALAAVAQARTILFALSYQTQRTGDPNAVRTGERETGSSAQGRHEARGDVRMSALAALRVAL